MRNNNYDIIIIIVSATIALMILLGFLISFLFIYKARQAKNNTEMKSVAERYQKEILMTQLEIREQTLKNISQEIHDNMGQVLSLVVLNLSSVEWTDPVADATKIENSTKLVKKVVNDLRNLSKTLDSDNMEKVGLCAIIRYELELLEKTGQYRTRFNQTGKEWRLEHSRETVAYRIVQESLSNVIRHAKATAVDINIEFTESQLSIAIRDYGIGFDPETATGLGSPSPNGAGLNNMGNRARLIGAELAIVSSPGAGTQVVLTIPFG